MDWELQRPILQRELEAIGLNDDGIIYPDATTYFTNRKILAFVNHPLKALDKIGLLGIDLG